MIRKTFAGSHKTHSGKRNYPGNSNSSNLANGGGGTRFNVGLNEPEQARFSVTPGGSASRSYEVRNKEFVPETVNGLKKTKCVVGGVNNDDSYEVWCICRLLKPCQQCKERERAEREKTPTPGNLCAQFTESAPRSKSSSATPTSAEKIFVDHVGDIVNGSVYRHNVRSRTSDKSAVRSGSYSSLTCGTGSANGFETRELTNLSDLSETTGPGINLAELFEKLDELNEAHDADRLVPGEAVPHLADTPPGTPTSSMDTASTCSFDHFDFDTSFCSLKSSDVMEHGDLADQLSLVQQMVVEMKTGFSRAMEELSKIQYGDQTLQQQLADNTKECTDEITTVKQTVEELKTEMQKLSGQLQEVSDTQRSLQEKLDTYQSDKDMLLDELEQSGAISDQTRLRLSGDTVGENNNTIPPDVAPMVHPYLNSLQNHHREEYNSDSSLTAAVSRSLNLTQALGEKCLNLDISTTSSDDEDNSRHSRSRSGSGHRPAKRHGSFQYEESRVRASQKIPPHERILDEVHREEAARDIVDAEREYCSQLWSLLEDYINPLRDETIVGRRELHLLFPQYITQIYEQHCILLRKMEERIKKWKTTGVIGDVFAKFTESQDGDGLLLYKDFINDFPTIINTMNKWFAHSPHFRELMQSQCLANSPVLQLLLAPLQQVPKYSILLKNLLKHTPVDHPDRYYLESSLTRLKQFLNSMNEDLEQAMQAINMNNQHVNRTRETGNSARSKSSASSGEINHVSRDSGVHSNEEERAKSPMSPNTSRRYLLQQLREKREKRMSNAGQDGHQSTPRARKQPGYGSHPDLSNQMNNLPEGRRSPYLTSLSQSKMFSSLSKLPLPREHSSSLRSRSRKNITEGQGHRPAINPNYLRPLTPQIIPSSISAHNFDSAKRREDYGERMRQRPASAMEFSYGVPDQHDDYIEMLAHQATLAISPPHSSSSDRSRRDLQQSLQKLLAETGNPTDEYSDHERDGNEGHVSYHKQFLATKERILRHRENNRVSYEADHLQEDFGIYGDDDDDDDNDIDDTQQEVQPMKLLQDSHRPKIMVPKWRQSALPQPPSYNHSVTGLAKKAPPIGSPTEANLAVSLAQSLFDGPKQTTTLPRDKKSQGSKIDPFDGTGEPVTSKSSLKRKSPSARTDSPTKSLVRQSPVPDAMNGVPVSKSLSFDTSPSRPANLNLTTQNNSSGVQGSNKQSSLAVQGTSQPNSSDPNSSKRDSVTKLTDVIAYTADCLEKSDLRAMQGADNDDEQDDDYHRALPEAPAGKITISDILADGNMKVSSVDNNGSSAEHTGDECEKQSTGRDLMSDSAQSGNKSPVNTDSVVYYFQNRDKINQGTNDHNTISPDPNARAPTFISMNKTSTPIHEHKPFSGQNTATPKDVFGNFGKKQTGRMVRGDEAKMESSGKEASDLTYNRISSVDSDNSVDKDGQEGATKERVLKAVDQLRLNFERKKQISEERRQTQGQGANQNQPRNTTSPTTTVPIQKQFNEISRIPQPHDQREPILRTFSSPTYASNGISDPESPGTADSGEQKHGLYKKASQGKSPLKYQSDTAASARQIQKLERATSPTGRSPSPTNINPYEKFKHQSEASNIARPTRGPTSPPRNFAEGSLIPQRSKSPSRSSRSSVERERPKSTTDFTVLKMESTQSRDAPGLKSAMKDTKIPVLKKSSSGPLSKSTEDISKIKKKTPLKDKFSNFFGRKKNKNKGKLYNYSCNGYDPDEEYNNHVTIATEPSFQNAADYDEMTFIPLSADRRSNSTSQILQCYTFEDDEPVSAV